MQTTSQTPTHRLADLLLADAGPLERFVRERRARKPQRSWRLIARDLHDATGAEVDLTGETLRLWFPDKPTKASA